MHAPEDTARGFAIITTKKIPNVDIKPCSNK